MYVIYSKDDDAGFYTTIRISYPLRMKYDFRGITMRFSVIEEWYFILHHSPHRFFTLLYNRLAFVCHKLCFFMFSHLLFSQLITAFQWDILQTITICKTLPHGECNGRKGNYQVFFHTSFWIFLLSDVTTSKFVIDILDVVTLFFLFNFLLLTLLVMITRREFTFLYLLWIWIDIFSVYSSTDIYAITGKILRKWGIFSPKEMGKFQKNITDRNEKSASS